MKPSELLSSPEKWTKKFFARDSDGRGVSYSSKDAVCFCIRGAIYRLYTDGEYERIEIARAVRQLFPDRGTPPLESDSDSLRLTLFNDHLETTFADIQAVLKEAGL